MGPQSTGDSVVTKRAIEYKNSFNFKINKIDRRVENLQFISAKIVMFSIYSKSFCFLFISIFIAFGNAREQVRFDQK